MINSQMTEIKIGEEFEYKFSSVNHAFLKIKLVNESMWLIAIDSQFEVSGIFLKSSIETR